MTNRRAVECGIDPPTSRAALRFVLIAEIDPVTFRDRPIPISQVLNFGRLSPHITGHDGIFPYCMGVVDEEPKQIKFNRENGDLVVMRGTGSIWETPGSGVQFYVQLLDVEPQEKVATAIAVLEDMYYGDLNFPKSENTFRIKRSRTGRTHQMIVFSGAENTEPSADAIQRLIYRADLPVREGYSSIDRPEELNRRPHRGAALGPFVSVIWGQQDYIENCAFLSVLIGTAASAIVADARRIVLGEISSIRKDIGTGPIGADGMTPVQTTRARLEATNGLISQTENRMALYIDGLSTLMPYIPALRAESYHQSLFNALKMDLNRSSLERLLSRLTELARVEQELLSARVDRAAEARSRRWSRSVGVASVLTIPLGIIFGFFGAAVLEVDATESMFSLHYWPLFASVGGATILIALVHFLLYKRDEARQSAVVSEARRSRYST